MDNQQPQVDGAAILPPPNINTPDNAQANNNAPALNRIQVRIPPFWNINPALWFRQIESQFIHLDIIGPLPISEGYSFCLIYIDRFTQYPKAIPLTDINAKTVATFFANWLSHFSISINITADHTRQFESEFFTELHKLLKFQQFRTAAYHPRANFIIERWQRIFKTALIH